MTPTCGDLLRFHRKRCDLTRAELASLVNCSIELIRKIERNQRRPSKLTADLIATQLKLVDAERETFLRAARSPLPVDDKGGQLARQALHNLPFPPTPLIGRTRELAEIVARLRETPNRLHTLVGPPGIGKTRLSIEAASVLINEFSDGVYFIPLALLSDPALVASAIAQPLGVQETGRHPLIDVLKNYVRDKSLLLVLDNFEHLLPAAPLVGELLSAAPRLRVLITSREDLRIYGEQEYSVPSLSLPEHSPHNEVEALSTSEAVALFVQRTQAVRSDFALTAENARTVADICICLDGLPLAIELAAARMKLHTSDTLLQSLNKRLDELTGGARDLPERHQTLRGAIRWSYDLLSEDEKRLFARLGVFVGGWTLEAMETVCSAHPPIPVYDGVESLLNKSLIQRTENAQGEPHYTFLETLRQYALEKLTESGEEAAIRQAHTDYFLWVAERAEPELRREGQIYWLSLLEDELDNLRAALNWSMMNSGVDHGLRLARALRFFWAYRGHWAEGTNWAESILNGSPMLLAARGKALLTASFLTLEQGDFIRSELFCQEALPVLRESHDIAEVALGFYILGCTSGLAHLDYEKANTLFEEGLELGRSVGDEWLCSLFLYGLAYLSMLAGQDLDRAGDYLNEGLPLSQQVGDRIISAVLLISWGSIKRQRKDYASAKSLLDEALALAQEAHQQEIVAHCYSELAHIALAQTDYQQAKKLLEDSLFISKELGVTGSEIKNIAGFAKLALANENMIKAVRLFGFSTSQLNRIAVAPLSATELSSDITALQTIMNQDDFAMAWTEGEAMTLEQAIAYALGTD